MRRESPTSGTGTRASLRLHSLLCLLSKELHRQPRAVYKYWAPCRLHFDTLRAVFLLVAGRPRCLASWPLWIRRTSTRSSSALAVACARLVLLVSVLMPLALCFDWFSSGPVCSALRPVWTRRTVARGVQVRLRIQCSACSTADTRDASAYEDFWKNFSHFLPVRWIRFLRSILDLGASLFQRNAWFDIAFYSVSLFWCPFTGSR